MRVCLAANTLRFPGSGGSLWAFLNWALGLRGLGCEVVWLEAVSPRTSAADFRAQAAALKSQLAKYGLSDCLALYAREEELASAAAEFAPGGLEAAWPADLLLNLAYDALPEALVRRFRRSAMVDIDPGLTQIWMAECGMRVPPHDVYFTIGETVGQPAARFPDCGIGWQYTPPPVYLEAWPVAGADRGAPYTTVTNWWGGWAEYRGDSYPNGKRDGFEPFLDLPLRAAAPLELAIWLGCDEGEVRQQLGERGWSVRHSKEVASTPDDYQQYIRASRGEFSCAKPSCVHLQNAWVSDRTLCYLASGKPAVVQHTGPSRFLPDAAGFFRFRDLEEAACCLERAESDYARQCGLARALAEEYFDSGKVLARVLEVSLG